LSAVQQPVLKFARIAALLAAAETILCAVSIIALQVTSWIENGVWDPYPVSSVIDSLRDGVTYGTASSEKLEAEAPVKRRHKLVTEPSGACTLSDRRNSTASLLFMA
jgi:hypothetical protein